MNINKKWSFVISLLIAILLWFYVFGQVNPTIKTTVKNVPIEFINVDNLDKNGFAIYMQDYESVNITYSAQRTVAHGLNKSDFKVTCDVEGLESGSETLRLKVTCPEDVTIDSLTTQFVKVVIEEKLTSKENIKVKIINDNSDTTEPYIVQLSNTNVVVTGAKSLIGQINSVICELDATKVTNDLGAFMVPVKAFDKSGNEISGLNFSSEFVSITANMANKKTVPLNVAVEGEEEERFRRYATYPEVITIKGSSSDLEKITSISTNVLDIKNIFKSTELPLVPVLPKGIQVAADSSELNANVSVDKASVKEFTYESSDITIDGVTSNTKPILEDKELVVTISGASKVIDKVEKGDIKLYVDVKGLLQGKNKVDVDARCDLDIDLIEINPSSINVTIG